MKIAILFSILLFAVNVCSPQSAANLPVTAWANSFQTKQISAEQAVKIAENFIIENGYTDLPAASDKKKIAFESIERTSDVEKILRRRHNTLEKRAYGILTNAKGGKGFTVVFQYVTHNERQAGRAVTMNLNGKNVRVEHKAIFLKEIKKL